MRVCLLLLVGLLTSAVADAGQAPRPDNPTPDFLFGRPDGSVGLRGSWIFARHGSDWYDFVTSQLTVENGDFNAPSIAADFAITLSNRIDAVIGVEYSQASVTSEYRNFVDNNRLPITQNTRLRNTNITGSIKYALSDRGRDISRFVWVPRTFTPFVGAGAGMVYFALQQDGDFVDYQDLSVFPDVFRANGWTPSAHVLSGVDVRVARRVYVTFDARYVWAEGDLGREWIDFDPIDLAGTRVSAGVNLVF